MLQRTDIRIRDPFILPVAEEGKYYLFGTTDESCWSGPGTGFDYYTSTDLENWQGPYAAFRPDTGFWGKENFWAPEVHHYRGRYYIFASFKAPGCCRATQILVADVPGGPYQVLAEPVTPAGWECLDGTLYVDSQDCPWLVFCHEWSQVGDGEVRAQRLCPDLRRTVDEPLLLFTASQAPWVRNLVVEGRTQQNYVTDGPFLFRGAEQELFMLWSSFGREGYAMGLARSASGKIIGPWTQQREPFFVRDGGHGMLFHTFQGQPVIALHQPNQSPLERPVFLPVEFCDEGVRVLPS